MDVVRTLIESQALSGVVIPIVLPSRIKGSEDDPFAITDTLNITGSFLRILLGSSFDAHKRLRTMPMVANSSSAMNVIANSETAMNVVANSSTAMNAIANSETAMNAIANSETAMNVVANSETVMNVIANSETAMNAIANSSTAMNVVANSETVMNAVVNSSTARSACLNSTTGRTFYLGSPYALSLIWADTTGSGEVWDRFDNISAVTKGTLSPAGGTYVYKSSGSGQRFDICITIPIDWTYVSQLSLQRYSSYASAVLGIDVLIGSTTIGTFRNWSGWSQSTFNVESYTGVQSLGLRFYYDGTASDRIVRVGDITFTLTS